jgi:hypothetical protein
LILFWSRNLAGAEEAHSKENTEGALCCSLGIGYPDLRARVRVWGPLDLEMKYALGDGVQAYSGRVYGRLWRTGGLQFQVGAEAGLLSFNAVESLSGNGSFYQAFAGAEYALGRRVALSADIGPAIVNVSDGKVSVSGLEWVYTTAFYFRVF